MFRYISANIGNNGSERSLPFKMWVNLPLTVTPYYEIMFAIEVLQIFIHVYFKLMFFLVFPYEPSSYRALLGQALRSLNFQQLYTFRCQNNFSMFAEKVT